MTLPRPQRLFAPSKPGTLLKHHAGTADVPQQPRKPDGDADRNYLILVRSLPCLKCGMEPSEATHVRFASAAFGKASGMQKRPPDKFAVPLCSGCHRLAKDAQHKGSERAFWEQIDINPLAVASLLWDARGDHARMVSVVHVVIAGRKKPHG
jgi:hypothetical protein